MLHILKNQTYKYLLEDARKELDEGHLFPALESLGGMALTLKAWSYGEKIEEIKSAYKSMLQFMVQGGKDEQRSSMFRNFENQLTEIADALERLGELMDEASHYTTTYRTLVNLYSENFRLADLLDTEKSDIDLFNAIWTSGQLTIEEEEALADFLMDEEAPMSRKQLVMTALTLGCISYYDAAKFRLLLDHTVSLHTQLRVRAVTGIVFIHIVHRLRLDEYPESKARLMATTESEDFVEELTCLQRFLFFSMETEHYEQHLEEELLPEMRKQINLNDKVKSLDEVMDDMGEISMNPEWDNTESKEKLQKTMDEFAALQQQGADLYMGSFKILKQQFSFFRQAANWFRPFDLNYKEVSEAARKSPFLQMILGGAGLCDSDKYSLCLMAGSMKSLQVNEAMNQNEELKKRAERMAKDLMERPEPTFNDEMRNYLQGFYRFCKLFIQRKAFVNPFEKDLFLVHCKPFDEILVDVDFYVDMADWAVKGKSIELAKNLLEIIPEEHRTNKILQKLGYCYERMGDFHHAAEAYRTALYQKGDESKWTIEHFADCLFQLQNYRQAYVFYSQLIEEVPDSTDVQLKFAHCLISNKQYKDALKCLYKLDYKFPDWAKILNPLAYCLLMTGKVEKAKEAYLKLLELEPHADYQIRLADAEWALGHVSEAIKIYRHAIKMHTQETGEVNTRINFEGQHTQLLELLGFTVEDILMMTDLVNSDIE